MVISLAPSVAREKSKMDAGAIFLFKPAVASSMAMLKEITFDPSYSQPVNLEASYEIAGSRPALSFLGRP